MPSKKIKIECGGMGRATKISIGGKDLLKEVPGIYGIELRIFVDGVTELKLYQHGKPVVFEGEVKLIKVFGDKEYCLVNKQYDRDSKQRIVDLKKEILSLKAELKK